MAQIFNEQRFIDEAIYKYEEKLNSPSIRFLDHTPVFTTYWHINTNESTTNEGLLDVEHIIGERSPIRFNKVENFPIYGLDSVMPQLEDAEFGLDTVFESEAIILPNSIKPLSNDFFVINHIHFPALFRVIDIEYDNMRPDNFYKIRFKLEFISDEKIEAINKQIYDSYECLLENVGTENKCIISTSNKVQIDKVKDMYELICSTYVNIFYNSRHNALLGDMGEGLQLYDPYLSEFVTKHNIINKNRFYDAIILTDQLDDPRKSLKYERSIYRFIERRDPVSVKPFYYNIFLGMTNTRTSFARWYDKSIWVSDIPAGLDKFIAKRILPEEVVDNFDKENEDDSKYLSMIKKYVSKKPMSIFDIPLDLHEEILKLDANLEAFFFVPIILYIINEVIDDFHNNGDIF